MNYYSRPEISNSDLTLINKGIEFYLDKNKTETQSQKYGRMVHKYILEKDTFYNEYIFSPYIDFKTKEAQIWRNSQTKSIIFDKDILTLLDKNFDFPIYGEVEKELYYELEGVQMRSKIDLYQDQNLYDLKTTTTLNESDVKRQFYSNGYGRQLAIYKEALIKNGYKVKDCFIIWINEYGYYRLMKVGIGELKNGMHEAKRLLEVYKNFINNGINYPQIEIGEVYEF